MSEQPTTTTTPSPLLVETTDLLYLLDLIKNEVKTEFNCHVVGTIQTFDPTTMTCTVNINYQKIFRKRNATSPAPNSYTDVVIPYPTLLRVPIVVMSGGGAYTTYPITGITYNSDRTVNYPGDTCLLLFCDRDIDGWLESGQITNPPFTARLHDLSDAVAIVGLNPVTKPIANYNTKTISMVDQTGNRLWLPGMGGPYFGAALPSGFLWCDGSTYSTSLYPFLFAAIGYTYGGSGNNFKVPQMAGQVPAGIGGSLGLTLGQEFGEVTHLLTGPESGIQAHSHQCNSSGGAGYGFTNNGYNTEGPYTTGITGPTDAQDSHNNVQPSFGVNWILKI